MGDGSSKLESELSVARGELREAGYAIDRTTRLCARRLNSLLTKRLQEGLTVGEIDLLAHFSSAYRAARLAQEAVNSLTDIIVTAEHADWTVFSCNLPFEQTHSAKSFTASVNSVHLKYPSLADQVADSHFRTIDERYYDVVPKVVVANAEESPLDKD